MNKTEYLLDCLMEEAAEIQKAASKCIRFGFDEYHPLDTSQTTNREELKLELQDLMAVELLLSEDLFIDFESEETASNIKNKTDKIKKYMEVSRECGRLHD